MSSGKGHCAVVALLLNRGANIEAQTNVSREVMSLYVVKKTYFQFLKLSEFGYPC
jgi:hypothetical protein